MQLEFDPKSVTKRQNVKMSNKGFSTLTDFGC